MPADGVLYAVAGRQSRGVLEDDGYAAEPER
jgi:hypothetical protein